MQHLTLGQFRAAHETGGFSAARVISLGSEFYVSADALTGDIAVLVRGADRKPRLFSDPTTAMKLLRDVGFAQVTVDLRQWSPNQIAMKERRGAHEIHN